MTANSGAGGYILKMADGTLEKVTDAAHAPDWSPDGNSLVFAAIAPGRHLFDQQHCCETRILDVRTKKISVLPTAGDWFGPWWPQPDKLVLTSSASDDNAPYLFDFKTQKWSRIDAGYNIANWVPSGDGKYLYMLTTDSQGAKIRRIRASDFKVAVFADLSGMHLVADNSLGQASSGGVIGIAADGSPTLTRDVGSDEIYAIDVKWP